MHEASIAANLLDLILQQADAHHATLIRSVDVDVGVLEAVEPDALQTAFQMAVDGTLAAGAALRIREVGAQARCRSCGQDYTPEVANYACPSCGRADADIVAGRGIYLHSIELDTE